MYLKLGIYLMLRKINDINKFFPKKGDEFRELWGENAGWAQTIMFIDDLKDFQKQRSSNLGEETKAVATEEVVDKPAIKKRSSSSSRLVLDDSSKKVKLKTKSK